MGNYNLVITLAPGCQGDAGNKPGVSAPPSTGRAGGFQSQGEWEECQDGSGFVVLQVSGMSAQGKLGVESEGWNLKCPDCESSEGGSHSDYYIILGWTLRWSSVWERHVWQGHKCHISEFPEAEGGMSTDSQLGKKFLETLHRPRAMDHVSRWKSLHHTQQHTMTRQTRGQQLLTSQLTINSTDL